MRISDWSSDVCSSDLAQASKAQIVGLANAGGDTINSIKQAAEFGIVEGGQKLAGMLMFITDVHALGLKTAQGLNFTTAWYWDANDANRAFAKKFAAANGGKMPTMVQADRKSVVSGKSVSVRVDLGGRRTLQKKQTQTTNQPTP